MRLCRPTQARVWAAALLAAGCGTEVVPGGGAAQRVAAAVVLAKGDVPTRLLRNLPAEDLRGLTGLWNLGFDPDGAPRFHVLAKLLPGVTLPRGYDLQVGSTFGGIASVYATRAGLDLLASHAGVQRIEAMRHMSLTNDISTTTSSLVVRDPSSPARQLSIPFTGGSLVLPFTPASSQPVQLRMAKQGLVVSDAGAAAPVAFTSTLTVCSGVPVNGACTGPALVTATGNGPGGDAVTAPTSFEAGKQVYVVLAGVGGASDAGFQPATVDVALTVVGDASEGYALGTKGRDSGNDGAGVIFADIDTGIDFCHPDFIDASGHTRILYLWDQSLTPLGAERSPPEPQFAAVGGVEYTQADIQASLASCATGNPALVGPVRMRDVDAHGTHTAGTAAGNGAGTPYIGAAPKADIIAVKGLGTGIGTQHLPEAIEYALVRARALGEPVAINNSWGAFGDEGDGKSLFNQQVSAVAGQGSVAIVAAGNSAAQPAHATSTTPPAPVGVADTWYLRQLECNPGSATDSASQCPTDGRDLSLWADPADAYEITLTDAAGHTATWGSCDLAVGAGKNAAEAASSQGLGVGPIGGVGTTRSIGDPSTGGTVAVNAASALGPGGQNIYLSIPAAVTPITGRVFWSITMTRQPGSTGTGVWDAYVGDGENLAIIPYNVTTDPPPPDPPPSLRHVTHLPNASGTTGYISSTYTPGQLSSPGTALGVVCVGASTGNVRWLDNSADAGGYSEPGDSFLNFPALGNLTYFSARGPTRDGRPLPHVAAPGMYVVSSASEFADPPWMADDLIFNPTNPGVATGVQHAVFSGTSMATPGVTGAAVLAFQSDPQNFPRPLIRNTAAHDPLTDESTATTGVPPQGWNGAGKMDAVAAIAALKAHPTPPVATSLVLAPTPPAPGAPLTLTVTATATPPAAIEEYLWDVDGDGYTDFFTNSTQATPNVLVTTAADLDGTFTARVIAVDSFGRTAAATASYTITGAFDAGEPDAGLPRCIPLPPDAGKPDAARDAGAPPLDAGHDRRDGAPPDAARKAAWSAQGGACGCGVAGAPAGAPPLPALAALMTTLAALALRRRAVGSMNDRDPGARSETPPPCPPASQARRGEREIVCDAIHAPPALLAGRGGGGGRWNWGGWGSDRGGRASFGLCSRITLSDLGLSVTRLCRTGRTGRQRRPC